SARIPQESNPPNNLRTSVQKFIVQLQMRFLPLFLALGMVVLTAQSQPQSTFRSGIDIVRLDVSVLDKERMPVRGLTAADFTVLEDGKPQPIVAFDAVDVPDRVRTGAAW